MFLTTLALHNLLRWAVLATAVYALVKSHPGTWKSPQGGAVKPLLFYMIALDLQLLLGLLLYFVFSPTVSVALSDMAGTMKNPVARFWAVEHILTMILAVVAVHVGKVWTKKQSSPERQLKGTFYTALISLFLILLAIPWPFREGLGRGLFPSF